MKAISIEKTNETPEINFNPEGLLTIKGVSTPTNVHHFYQPLFDWITAYKQIEPPKISLEIFIDYLNTSSTRIMIEMISLIKSFHQNGTRVNITWCYDEEDEDMLEMGEEFEAVTQTDFTFKAITV